jgi:hypothetical protein
MVLIVASGAGSAAAVKVKQEVGTVIDASTVMESEGGSVGFDACATIALQRPGSGWCCPFSGLGFEDS